MKRSLAPISLAMSLAVTAVAEPSTSVPITTEQRMALGIVVGIPERIELVPRPQLPGRITLPNAQVRMITAGSPGLLLSPLVAVGDSVSPGDELARIESPAFVALQREYLEALTQLDLTRSTARREEQLADEGIIAGRRAAQSAALLHQARTRLEERQQALMLAGMSEDEFVTLDRTHKLRSTLIVRAPFEGVVLEQYARAGERLEASGALYRIGDIARLTVDIHTPIDIARTLDNGTRFILPDLDAAGRVITVGGEIHSLDQGVLVRGTVDGGRTQLRPGQFVRVQFETPREHGTAFAVPATGIVHIEQQAWIFRESAGGFEALRVAVVGGSGEEIAISGPLADGAAIAIHGTAALKAHWLTGGGPD
ncbi:MAG: HlyD family efflux transporter periplasmic adaptor subunit [bacterium]|nr:hypothetical protein [Deltaproteobacteria bacterium]MCP4907428.1 HlyD family efflux transporter periplasmic adaptor subunit [bacterium]